MYFYNYSGEVDIVNKSSKLNNGYYVDERTLTNYSLSVDGGTVVLPYSLFETITDNEVIDGANFNYCTYYYGVLNNIQVGAFVSLTHAANGMCVATLSVDPLYTCWLNGCMNNTTAIVLYTKSGYQWKFDNRIPLETKMTRESIELIPYVTQPNSVISGRGYNRITVVINVNYMTVGVAPTSYNPVSNYTNTRTYILSYSNFIRFCTEITTMTSEEQVKYCSSINKITLIPETYDDIRDVWLVQATSTSTITLTDIDMEGVNNTYLSTKEISCGEALDLNSVTSGSFYVPHITDGNTIVSFNNPSKYSAAKLKIPFIGEIDFLPSDFMADDEYTLNAIGHYNYYDLVGSAVKCTLVINGVEYKEYNVVAPLSEQCPFLSSATYRNVWTTGYGVLQSIGDAIFKTQGNISFGNTTRDGKTTSQTSTGGLLTYQGGWNAIKSIFNAEADINAANVQPAKVNGGISSNIERTCKEGLTLYIHYHDYKPTESIIMRVLYGYPFGAPARLNELEGWVQTNNVHLPCNSLPYHIVNEAEITLNNGCHMT